VQFVSGISVMHDAHRHVGKRGEDVQEGDVTVFDQGRLKAVWLWVGPPGRASGLDEMSLSQKAEWLRAHGVTW